MLLGLLTSGALEWAPGWLRLVCAFSSLVWIPGVILLRAFSGGAILSLFLSLSLGFLTGMSAQSILALGFVATGTSLGAYEVSATWFAIAILGAGLWERRRPGGGRGDRRRTVLAAVLLVSLATVAASVQVPPSFEQDSYDHIGYVRRTIEEGRLRPTDVIAMPVDDPDPLRFDARKGTFHALLAAIADSASLDPYDLWQLSPIFVFPFSFLAFLAFCGVFVERRSHLIWCAVLFAISYGGVGLHFPRSVLYGQNLSVFWYWGLAALCLLPRDIPRRRLTGLLVLLSAGGVAVHAGVFLHAALLAATLVLFAPVFGQSRRTGTIAAVALFVAAIPVMGWRISMAGQANVIHSQIAGVLFLTPRWFVISPMEILRQHGMLFLGGIALLPVTLFLVRTNPSARRQWAASILPLSICFLPFLATPLTHRATYMVFRSLLNVPAYAAIVVTLVGVAAWSRRGGLARRVAATAVLAGWTLAFAAPTLRAVAAEVRKRHPQSEFLAENLDVVRYLRTLPPDAIVATDPRTAYALSAFTPHRFVAIYGQHANPFDRHAMERLRAACDILSPWATGAEVTGLCERYGVDIVVVNGRTPTRANGFLNLWDRGFFDVTSKRLASFEGRFRPVFVREGMHVFLHDAAGASTSSMGSPQPPIARPAPQAWPCRVESPDGDYEITSVAVEPAEALPGEDVTITVGYSRTTSAPFGFPHVVHVRFDNESIERHHFPGDKYLRRVRERRAGEPLRFRRDRVAFDGLFPREYWPIGMEFSDAFTATVPPGARTGRWRVEVSIERETLLPNFTIDDLLYNRDHYSGTGCGTLTVTDRAVR